MLTDFSPMNLQRVPALRQAIGVVLSLLLLISYTACTKIEKTTLGGELIPEVDYVYTFDSILPVVSNNFLSIDSTRITAGSDHLAGGISNDPVFGTSRATMFFEFKPFKFPFKFTDSVRYFDSAVLILRFNGHYGDSNSLVHFNLYEVDRRMQPDTTFLPFYNLSPDLGINRSKLWGTKSMQARMYRDTIRLKYGDSVYAKVVNQLRIPLNPVLARALFEGDSATVYGNDSIYKSFMPGFALEAQGTPNALHYFGIIGGTGSGIEFYYQSKKGSARDTVRTLFAFNNSCSHAVKFERNRSGAEIENFLTQNPTTGVPQVYIDGTPGAMASLSIPGLKTLTNRVLHRAELRVTEIIPDGGPLSYLRPPSALYLDAEYEQDPGNFRGIPYDLSPFSRYYCFPPNGIDFSYFGGIPRTVVIDGQKYMRYTFNITRYVQSLISRSEPYFNFRLSAPYYMVYKDCFNSTPPFPSYAFPFLSGNQFINDIGESRLKVAGGNYPDPRFRMQLRIIYSRF